MGVGIEVKDLNAWFGKAQVLKEINIKVGANAVTAVIGPRAAASPRSSAA
jgi:phosphate transport system ATP-binding protein